MKFGIKSPWSDRDYAMEVEPLTPHGVPSPMLSQEILNWLLVSTSKIFAEYAAFLNKSTVAKLVAATAVIARYTVVGAALRDGRQFASFSRGQFAAATGWTENSVDNVLHILMLEPTKETRPKVRAFIQEAVDRRVDPVIRRIESGTRGMGTAYEMIGISPAYAPWQPESGLCSALDTLQCGLGKRDCGPDDCGCDPKRCVSGPDFAVCGPEIAVPDNGPSGPIPGDSDPEIPDVSGPRYGEFGPDGGSGSLGLSSSQINTHSSPSAEESYQIVVNCFLNGAGTKLLETRQAFDMRIAQGWTPEAIAEGARRYANLPTVPSSRRSAKWTYPLKWLLDDDHFKAMCPRAEHVSMTEVSDFKAFFAHDVVNGRIPCVQCPGKSPVVVTFPVPPEIENDQLEEWLKRERAEEVVALISGGR